MNLDYQEAIEYECGMEMEFAREYLLSVEGYYKDDVGLIGLQPATWWWAADAKPEIFENCDYARTRGVEIELKKRFGRYMSWLATYDYSFALGKTMAESFDPLGDISHWSATEKVLEIPLDWDQRHAVTLTLNILVPPNNHPRMFGLYLPDDCGLNVLWRFGSGYPYWPGAQHPGASLKPGGLVAPNSLRLPATSTVDVRFNKNLRLGRANYTFQVWVMNLFDKRDVLSVGSQTGRPETQLNLGGLPYLGDIEADPRNWGPGRQIRVEVGVDS